MDRKRTIPLLPDELVSSIVHLLSYEDLRSLLLCCKRALLSERLVGEVFSSRSRLHIPVTGSTAFKDPVTACVARLPTNYVVGDPATLLTVRALHGRVHSLEIQDGGGFDCDVVWKRPLTPLRFLTHLIDLEVGTDDQLFVDLRELHAAAPQLVRLNMNVRLPTKVNHWHVLRNFKMLRVLKLKLWEAWDMENIVGIPLLDELHIQGLYKIDICNISALAKVHPLRVLLLSLGTEDEDPAILQPLATHLPTLNRLCDWSKRAWPWQLLTQATQLRELMVGAVDLGVSARASLLMSPLASQLRELHVVEEQVDIQALATLASLERLYLKMHADATDCRSLRHLCKLRSLHIVDGWVRDFITYLPNLETLRVEDTGTERRSFLEPEQPLEGFRSPVLRVTLASPSGEFGESSFMLSVLQNAVEVTVQCPRRTAALITAIWSLHKIKRLAIVGGPGVLHTLPSKFASLDCLEELYLDRFRWTPTEQWSFSQAKSLRVLVADLVPSLGVVSTMTSLQRLSLPFYEANGVVSPILSLHRLREVSLPASSSCRCLRAALGPGGMLPELRKILHPRQNCLLWDPCPCKDPSPASYIDMAPFKPAWVALL